MVVVAVVAFLVALLVIYLSVHYAVYGTVADVKQAATSTSGATQPGGSRGTDVRTGVFLMKKDGGPFTVATDGITPEAVEFYDFGTVTNSMTRTDSRLLPQGLCVGYASKTPRRQQCMQNGMSGLSMNTAGRFASDKHCIGYRFQGRNNLQGVNSARLEQWGSQSFTLRVDSHYRDSLVMYVAYGPPSDEARNVNLRSLTGLVHLERLGVAKIPTPGFQPHTAVFHVQPHYIRRDMNTNTAGDRFAATYDAQDGTCMGYATSMSRSGLVRQQFISNGSHGANTNRTHHFASDENCLGYAYVDTNGNVRDRTMAHVGSWRTGSGGGGGNGLELNVTQLAEPMLVQYTVYGYAPFSSGGGERVHTGDVLLEKEGEVKVSGLSVVPSDVTFQHKAYVTAKSLNSQSGVNRQDMPSVHGHGFGFASTRGGDKGSSDGNGIRQQATCNSSSGSSTNRTAFMASPSACAVMKYVDRNGNTLQDGITSVKVQRFTEDGFVLHVDRLAGAAPSLLMFAARGTPSRIV